MALHLVGEVFIRKGAGKTEQRNKYNITMMWMQQSLGQFGVELPGETR